MQPSDELRGILLRAFPGARIDACKELNGGLSARAVVVDLALQDTTQKRVVVRRPSYPTREETLRVVTCEHALLSRCTGLGIPAPKPCFLDLESAAVVLEYLEGAPEFAPSDSTDMLRQMASQLAAIHRVPLPSDFGFLSPRKQSAALAISRSPERLDQTLDEERLRSVLAELWPWHQHNPDAILHGDYWPGNLLWKHSKLVAVLDWEEAEAGDPLADLAVSRLDISWAFGEAAMHDFTRFYREQTQIDWRNLARWDLCVALRPMSQLAKWAKGYADPPISRPDITELSMRHGHRRFVAEALRNLD